MPIELGIRGRVKYGPTSCVDVRPIGLEPDRIENAVISVVGLVGLRRDRAGRDSVLQHIVRRKSVLSAVDDVHRCI